MKRARVERVQKGMWWDEAWSLVSGCTAVSSGCRQCWAAEFAHRQALQDNVKIRARYGGTTRIGAHGSEFNGVVRFMHGDLLKPFGMVSGRVFSVWTDLWHPLVSDWQIALTFAVMMATPKHDYVICTKRPERMAEWFKKHTPADCFNQARSDLGFPFLKRLDRFTADDMPAAWPLPNVIGMVTVEDQAQVQRVPHLLAAPFAVRAVACEPLLGSVDLTQHAMSIDWVTLGCENSRGANCRAAHPAWFDFMIDQCIAAGTPLFLKQMKDRVKLMKLPIVRGRRWDEFPE